MYTAKELRALLREHLVTVTFEKKDGTLREMFCTLKADFLPLPEELSTIDGRIDTIITVLDLEKNEWRSFRLDSVLSVELE